jgi:ParB-like chromosome segregation protein Spo0J
MAKLQTVGLRDFKIEMVAIDKLIPYVQNPKAHPESQINKIASSIKNFGFLVPLVIDAGNEIVCGHGRLLAAHKLNLGVVPCVRADNLTPAEIRAFRIMDNRSSESEWLPEFLDAEIKALQEMDFDITLAGFSKDELEFLDTDLPPEKAPKNEGGNGGGTVTCPECGHKFSVLKEE